MKGIPVTVNITKTDIEALTSLVLEKGISDELCYLTEKLLKATSDSCVALKNEIRKVEKANPFCVEN